MKTITLPTSDDPGRSDRETTLLLDRVVGWTPAMYPLGGAEWGYWTEVLVAGWGVVIVRLSPEEFERKLRGAQ